MPAPTFVQAKSNDNVSFSTTYNSAVAAGNTLFMIGRVGGAATSVTVSDSVNGSWTVMDAVFGSVDGDTLIIARLYNTAAGTPAVTVSYTGSGSFRWGILEYTACTIDQYTGISNSANSAAPHTPNATTTSASETLLAILEMDSGTLTISSNGSGSNPTSGWTNRLLLSPSRLVVDDVSVSSTGTYGETWALSGGSDDGQAAVISLVATAATATLPEGNLPMMGVG